MADNRYIGRALATAQVDRFTPANVEIGDIFSLKVTGLDKSFHTIRFVATAGTVANVVDNMVTLWNASTNALCTGITASKDGSSTYMELTADVAGEGFDVSATAVNGGGANTQTFTKANQVAGTGPKYWGDTENWSAGTLPGEVSSENVYVYGAEIKYQLDQSSRTYDLSSLHVSNSIIGADPVDGQVPDYLKIDTAKLYIGEATGAGVVQQRYPININVQNVACEVYIFDTGRNDPNPGVRILANNAGSKVYINKGRLSIAAVPGETATIGAVYVLYDTSRDSDSYVRIGKGVTLTTLETYSEVFCECGVVNFKSYSGKSRLDGVFNITSFVISGGECDYRVAGTTATMLVEGGKVSCLKSKLAKTISSCTQNGGTIEFDPNCDDITFETPTYPCTIQITKV